LLAPGKEVAQGYKEFEPHWRHIGPAWGYIQDFF
jgi:hypothetical protein